MPKYFKPKALANNANYQVTRRTKTMYIRDQLPCEGIYTEHEMSLIVERDEIPGEWLDVPKKNVGFVFGLRQIVGEWVKPSPIAKAVKAINDYCERYGNGIYSTTYGGRYFKARINATGKLECWHGYVSDDNEAWIEFADIGAWHNGDGQKVFIPE